MECKNYSSAPKYLHLISLINLPFLLMILIFDLAFTTRVLFLIADMLLLLALTICIRKLVARQLAGFINAQANLAASRERYLIAAEIHETVTPLLFATTLITNAMLAHEATCPCEIVTSLKDLHQLTSTTHKAIRHVLLELRPMRIDEIPLDHLITELVQIKRFSTETDIQCMVIGTAHYPPDIHQGLYRIVDLALSNSVLHAQASYILVRLFLSQDEAIVTVEDNGRGFDHTERKGGHYGLEDIETCACDIGAVLDWNTLPGPNPKEITCIWRRPTWN